MDINKLMIGDYVKGFSDNTYAKVLEVSYSGLLLIVTPEGQTISLNQEDIQPIPLTGEILEKNGFEEVAGGFGKISRQDDEHIHQIRIDFGREWIEVYHSYQEHSASNMIVLKVNNFFVHKLQHALRLAGLEEMANNFKV